MEVTQIRLLGTITEVTQIRFLRTITEVTQTDSSVTCIVTSHRGVTYVILHSAGLFPLPSPSFSILNAHSGALVPVRADMLL